MLYEEDVLTYGVEVTIGLIVGHSGHLEHFFVVFYSESGSGGHSYGHMGTGHGL